jgi:hypothetical protein
MPEPDKRKRKLKPDEPPTPEIYKASILAAKERSLKRRHGPLIAFEPGSADLKSPFSDWGDDWHYIVVDAFGTRSHMVAGVFIGQLAGLVSTRFDDEAKEWVPDEAEMQMLLHVVAAYRPKNEAEAILAAQIAAANLLTMTVAERAVRFCWDDKTIGSFAKLARTSATLIEAMATLKGKKKSSRQQITVRHEKHVHHHQHVHLEGGSPDNVRQPQGTEGSAIGESAALLGESEVNGTVLPFAGREGAKRLPSPRGGGR